MDLNDDNIGVVGRDPEICITCGGALVYAGAGGRAKEVVADTSYPVNADCSFVDSTTMRIWDNDPEWLVNEYDEYFPEAGTELCGTAPDHGDDLIRTETIAITDPAIPLHPVGPILEDGFPYWLLEQVDKAIYGYLSYDYRHDSLPFRGALDELQLYRQVLDAEAVKALYDSLNLALHLKLDEAPGESWFADAGAGAHHGACIGASCPLTGVSGRISQAPQFTTADQDRIALASFGDFGTTTVSAWVYRTESTTERASIVSYKEDQTCGFVLALNNNGSSQYPVFYARVDSAGVGAWQQAEQAVEVPLNTWVHLTGVYDGQKVRLYRNGVEVASTDAAGGLHQCTGNTAIGSRSSQDRHFFGGRIDDVQIYSRGLAAADIQALYDRAPVLHLRLDETQIGGASFADNTENANNGACTGSSCPVTGEGIQGKMGLAALLDGYDDEIVVADDATVRPGTFTAGAWVLPTEVREDAPQEIIVRSYYEDSGGLGWQPTKLINYRLYIAPGSLVPVAEFSMECTDHTWRATSAVPLLKDHWNHVMATFDGTRLALYVNGTEQAYYADESFGVVNACTAELFDVHIGGFSVDLGSGPVVSNPFSGRLDEVTLYSRALPELEINSLYRYQFGWIEQRQSQNLVVDLDDPATTLQTPASSYVPTSGMLLQAVASDATSDIAAVGLGYCQGDGCTPGNWADAEACVDGGWCPYFAPGNEGRYTLATRATDLVGHQGTSSYVTLYADGAAPDVTGPATGMRLDAYPAPDRANAWIVPIEGTVSDPDLAGGSPGSGVAAETVKVTLYDEYGGLAGAGSQLATLAGNAWSVDYVLTESAPDGVYTVKVEARDEVSRLPGLLDNETVQSGHTGRFEASVSVDALGPVMHVDQTTLPATAITPTTTLAGDATQLPVPITVTWTADYGTGDLVGLSLACDGVRLADIAAGTFPTSTTTYTWEGTCHRGAACAVDVTGGAAVKAAVCGTIVTTANGAFTASAASCPAPPAYAGISEAQTAFVATFPGSPFHNETLSGQLAYLPLADSPTDTGSLTFKDASGHGHDGSCPAGRCPATGQPGHGTNAPYFDGVDDLITYPRLGGIQLRDRPVQPGLLDQAGGRQRAQGSLPLEQRQAATTCRCAPTSTAICWWT